MSAKMQMQSLKMDNTYEWMCHTFFLFSYVAGYYADEDDDMQGKIKDLCFHSCWIFFFHFLNETLKISLHMILIQGSFLTI